jgi:hypothetical protein
MCSKSGIGGKVKRELTASACVEAEPEAVEKLNGEGPKRHAEDEPAGTEVING